MKKLLVLAYQFPPYGGGGSIRVYNFCRFFREFGWEPHVLSIKEEYYDASYHSPELLAELTGKIHLYRAGSFEPKAKSFRSKVFGLEKAGVWDRLKIGAAKQIIHRVMIPDRNVLWFPKAVSLGNAVIKQQGVDAIFSTAPPFTSHLVARALAKRNKLPFFLDYRDDWAGNPLFVKHGGLTAAANRILEKTVIQGAAKIFCATERSREFILEKYGRDFSRKVVHLSNGFDPDFLERVSPSPRRNSDRLNILHMGSLTPNRSPESLLAAMKMLEKEYPARFQRTRLLLYGYTHGSTKGRIEEFGMGPRVTLRKQVAYGEVPRILAEECDVALSIQSSEIGGDTAIPGKIYEYMAMEKPILNISDGGAVWRFLAERGSIYNAHYDDPSEIFKILVDLHSCQESGTLEAKISEEEIAKFNRKELTRLLCEEMASSI